MGYLMAPGAVFGFRVQRNYLFYLISCNGHRFTTSRKECGAGDIKSLAKISEVGVKAGE